jgi:hypothetical protein
MSLLSPLPAGDVLLDGPLIGLLVPGPRMVLPLSLRSSWTPYPEVIAAETWLKVSPPKVDLPSPV